MLWLGIYLGIGVALGLLMAFTGTAIGDYQQFRPGKFTTTAIFWPFWLFWMIWMWLFARKKRISLDETTNLIKAGAVLTEIRGYLARHPNATEEERTIAARQIVDKHQAG